MFVESKTATVGFAESVLEILTSPAVPLRITSVTSFRPIRHHWSNLEVSMRLIKTALFVLAIGLASFAQDATQQQTQLTQVPPKPSCNPDALFHTKACEDL